MEGKARMDDSPVTANDRRTANSKFDIRRADRKRFSKSLKDLSGSRLGALDPKSAKEAEIIAGELQEIILEACKICRGKEFSESQIRDGRIDKNEKRGLIQGLRGLRNQRTDSEVA